MLSGIDTISHIYAMEEKGKTIAVLGSGFEHIYPKENTYLYHQILQNGGCILSENPPEAEVKKSYFPKRNRIISGLAMGVLVVEAAYRSGSTITAKYAMGQGKQVFCIPNQLGIATGYSTNLLIQNGANLVMEPEDIFAFYEMEEEVDLKVEEEYQSIYDFIGELPISINELARLTKTTIQETMQIITMLELQGFIQDVGGGRYAKKEKK